MTINDKYHFHKECVHYPDCIEKEDRIDGHNVIRLWCPKKSEILHQKTDKLKGNIINLGEAYDRAGGYPYYKSDLHGLKEECILFEPFQLSLFN